MSTPAAAPPEKPMAAPSFVARLKVLVAKYGREVVLKSLALIMVWGLGAFAWGSLNAWYTHKAKQQLSMAVQAAQPRVEEWLAASLYPLQRLAGQPELLAALQTPLHLAGPSAKRALDAWASEQNDPDLALFDGISEQTLTPLGTTPPSPEIFKALQNLPATTAKLVATGTRTGMVYFAYRLPGKVGQQLYAVRARSIRQLATAWQQTTTPETIELTLTLPHTAGAAQWRQTEPLRLQPVGEAPHLVKTVPSQMFPDVALAAIFLQPPAPIAWQLYALIILWLLGGTLLVLWPYTAAPRGYLWHKVAPWLGPWLRKLQQWGGVFNNLRIPILSLKAYLEKFQNWRKQNTSPREESWQGAAPKTAAEVALISGPGVYSAADFNTGNPPVALPGSNKPKLKPFPTLKQTPAEELESQNAGMPPVEEVAPDVLKARIQRCIRQGLIELLYQPMYRTENGNVEGNEVLARLADASGPIAPGQFLPVLAALKQISSLDALVFEKVMGEHFAAGKSPPVMLSINISGTSLEDLSYLRDVAQRGPSVLKHLMFEVRSNEVVRDPNALQLLKALQRQGARVAVDYFGGGAAMVEASKALGIDYVKIDIMRFSGTSALKAEFTEVCALAGQIGLAVVVEKIEDKEMENLARRGGATLLQGYGMGKPTPNLMTLPLSAKL
jgi:EAL domain-containing protein (putative c-di-GMP-specific phosphodiesterase class I)